MVNSNEGMDTRILVTIAFIGVALFSMIFIYRSTTVYGIGTDLDVDNGTLFVNSSDSRVGVRNKSPTYTLDVIGDINTNTKLRENGFALIPFGTIVMWTGSTAPTGWALCDGTNGTPDLRGRFILSQGQGSGLTNRLINQVGGAETHVLTTSEMPAHTHTGTTVSNGDHSHTGTTNITGDHSHTGSTNTTGAHTHNLNMVETDDGNFSNEPGQYPTGDANKFNGDDHFVSTETAGDHAHTLTTNTTGDHSHTVSTNTTGTHTHTFTTDSTGGDQAHNNMPPYFVLAYIMKL
jgi:microcystin-dependent protein